MIIFRVFNEKEKNKKFALRDLPKRLDNPFEKDTHLDLIGVVAYSHGKDGDKEDSSNGHYSTFVYRRGNTGWMEINDLWDHTVNRKEKVLIVPRILMFIKTKN